MTESWERWKPATERIQDLEAEVKKLKELVLDLREQLDDLPLMHGVYKAVQELQSEAEAPAAKWVHYLR